MKNIIMIFTMCLITFFASQKLVFADEIIDSQGNIIKCTVETVEEDFVQYKKHGNMYSFTREQSSPIFNDFVDVRVNLWKEKSIKRISGKILFKDIWNTLIENEEGRIDIPFYRVENIGVYKPN